MKAGEITLKLPERSKFDLGWAATKPRVIDRLRTQLKPKSIRIVEEYVTPAGKEPATKESAPKEAEKSEPSAPAAHEGGAAGHGHAAAHEPAKGEHGHAATHEPAKGEHAHAHSGSKPRAGDEKA